MANELIPTSTTFQEKDRPSKFDANLEPLKAGQFWKSSHAIPEKVEVSQVLMHKWDDNEEDKYHERRKLLRRGIEGGVVLLVQNLKYDDRGLHTVIVAAHPLWENQGAIRFLAAEFYEYFERCFDAETVRLIERQNLEAELSRIQQEIVAGPPPADIPALLEAPKVQGSPSVGMMVEHVKAIGNLKAQTLSVIDTANRHAGFIQGKVKEIGEATKLLARFYNEHASASLAATSDVIEYAEHLKKGVASMGLYTGEGVEINTWVRGEPAAADEPIWLFQDRLYLEEEYLVALNHAGMDKNSMRSFITALQTDHGLRDRILPYPRTVVLARIRRDGVIYNSDAGIGAMYENMIANQPNLTSFLLIRNGENIHQVWSELATDTALRLFPSGNDVDAIFKGIDGKDISVDDLNYTDKLDEHEKYALFYKRLLILLWGLNDNHQIFGEFYDPATYRGFFDIGFQTKHFRFVHEDEVKLGTQRPAYDVWFQQMNAHLQSGSRVLVYLPANWNSDQVSGAFSMLGPDRDEPCERLTWAGGDAQLLIAKRQGGRYFVEVQSKHTYTRSTREPVLKLFLGSTGHRRHANDQLRFSHLVMDAVKPGDIAFYRESRTNRRHYARYMETLFAIGNLAKEQFELEASFKSALIDAATQGRLKIPSGTSLAEAADNAVRLWRASHRGEVPPSPGMAEYAVAIKSALSTLYRLLRAGHDPMSDMPAFLAASGLTPLRFVMTGKGRFGLYVVTPECEREERIYKHVWVTRIAIQQTKAGLEEFGRKLVIYPKATAEEQTLHEWPDNQGAWADESMPDNLTPASITKLIDESDANLYRLKYIDGEFDWNDLFIEFAQFVDYSSKTKVVLPSLVVQVGIHCREDSPSVTDTKNGVSKFNRLIVRQGVAALLFKHGDLQQKERLRGFFRRYYKEPEAALKWLETLGDDQPTLSVYYTSSESSLFEKAGYQDRGKGIPRNWQEVFRRQDRTNLCDYINRQYVARPLRSFSEAVPHLSKTALKWINDHATQPDAKLK